MADVLMERGYSYHAMFIYNKPKLKNNRHRNQDFQVSFDVVKFAVDKLASWGFRQTYYHDRDALPGSNIFSEFFDTVKASRFTVVVLTRGFLNDCWGKYKSQAAFSKLLEEDKTRRFIVMYIDLQDQQIPNEFNTMESLCFKANWQSEDEEWEKFKRILKKVTQPVQDTGPDRYPGTQTNSGSQNAILTSRGTLQHPQAALAGENLLAGLQETNPPNYPRANSILETDAGPHDQTETIDNLQPVNQNTTNNSDNRNPSNQQSDGGNQHSLGFSVTQSNDESVIYQKNSTNGMNSNNSASVAIATNLASTTSSSLHVVSSQSTTQTGVGQTSTLATPPTTEMSTTGNNMEEQAAQAVVSTSTTMQTSGTSAQIVASKTTAMKNVGTRMPPDGATTNSPTLDAHSDTNIKNKVDRDNGNEDYLFSSLSAGDIEIDNSGRSITDNQLNIDSLIKKSHTCLLPTEQLVRQKDEPLNSQPDSGIDQGLNMDSFVSEHQDTNCFNTSSIGMNRPNINSALPSNNSDGYKSKDESSANSQGASLLLSTMRRMLPDTRPTMRNTVGTMIKPIAKFVQKCDQSFF
ncbi:uncharacterized protein LOC143071103 [Mytilus galloprovincialis]|uniref:uncharacterized protein LOC143071103 n=1 Tax=Mytilus galloprovincialis TaxID=29158 RepID=UPI003F7BE7B9